LAGYDAITDIPGIKVGHWSDRRAITGCTVVLCEKGAVGGVDVRGGAPGTRDTDALRPGNLVPAVNAIVLSGGSAFGLESAAGVMRWCEEHGIGLEFGRMRIPIVAGAILFDLGIGRSDIRPDTAAGYAATAAARGGGVPQGSVGAGTGATVAKAGGSGSSLKGGIGSASEALGGGITVAAIMAVNAVGEIVDSRTGKVVAGPRGNDGMFVDSFELLKQGLLETPTATNTTIGVVATNARLTKEQANRLATVAHDGLARAIRPAHTLVDGDTIFALATGEIEVGAAASRAVEAFAPRVVERAIVKGVLAAKTLGGVPSVSEWTARPGEALRGGLTSPGA
jgi:L-aminopeptidase/D-esterase-like protein